MSEVTSKKSDLRIEHISVNEIREQTKDPNFVENWKAFTSDLTFQKIIKLVAHETKASYSVGSNIQHLAYRNAVASEVINTFLHYLTEIPLNSIEPEIQEELNDI